MYAIRSYYETQQVRYGGAGTPDRIGCRLVGHLEFADESLERACLLERIEIFALDVLDERHRNRGFVRNLPDDGRNFLEPGQLRRAPAPLAGDDFVFVFARGAHEDRLQQTSYNFV